MFLLEFWQKQWPHQSYLIRLNFDGEKIGVPLMPYTTTLLLEGPVTITLSFLFRPKDIPIKLLIFIFYTEKSLYRKPKRKSIWFNSTLISSSVTIYNWVKAISSRHSINISLIWLMNRNMMYPIVVCQSY